MKKFLTLFPETENVHLLKDVGMIPFLLNKQYDYESFIACYSTDKFHYLENEVKGLKVTKVDKKFRSNDLNNLYYVIKNAKHIDVIQMYHFKLATAIILVLAKLISPTIVTYLKLDADYKILDLPSSGIKHKLTKFFSKYINVISVETKSLQIHLNEKNIFGTKVNYIPNGFYDNGIRKNVDFAKKENLIITVGRIGTKQKATEVLCEAFILFAKKDKSWRLEIIGPVDESFIPYINEYFKSYPDLIDRVVFLGNIESKELLAIKYENAKIFVLPSRWEGFALVYLEALRAGCYMICSDILPAYDVTDNQKYGGLFEVDNSLELSKLLLEVTNKEFLNEKICLDIQNFAYSKFYWPKIVSDIQRLISKH